MLEIESTVVTATATPTVLQDVPDGALLQRYFVQGDAAAMDCFFARHTDAAYRVALSIVGNRADAEDVVQTAFLNVLTKGDGSWSSATPNLRGWLMSIVVRRGLNAIRGENRRAAATAAVIPGTDVQPTHGARDAVRRVLELIDQLDEPKRLTMLLVAEGLAPAEIAEMTGEERGAVATRICRTRAQLAKQAADEGLIDVSTVRGRR